jgi:serine/threonine protein kinase
MSDEQRVPPDFLASGHLESAIRAMGVDLVGTSIGVYRITSLLGAGGMGEVYRARDTKLEREVAVKILPREFTADADRRARFAREARLLAALNHPHIAQIYGLEQTDPSPGSGQEGGQALVMEFVPGETLAAVINGLRGTKHALKVQDALAMARQIADALDAAHNKGIVHRDLKPANIKVTPEGSVKMLDFGLAKLTDPASELRPQLSGAPEMTADGTRQGVILGTAAYMSPEQARGQSVDKRTDIWAFGCVLFEMLTGHAPFPGDTISDTIAKILEREPDWAALPDATPVAIRRLLRRCLRKDPGQRLHDIADARIEIEEVLGFAAAIDDVKTVSESRRPAGRSPSRAGQSLAWSIASVLIVAAVVAGILWLRPEGAGSPAFAVQLSSEPWAGSGSFSPDGLQIAYGSAGNDGANWDIWLKIVGQAEARRLTTDPAAEGYPAWSPDGTQIAFLRYHAGTPRGLIAFFAAGSVYLISPVGGTERKLTDFPVRLQPSWSADGKFLAVAKARQGIEPSGAALGIWLISTATGDVTPLTQPKPQTFEISPAFSPDGRQLAYASCHGVEGNPICDVYVQPIDAACKPTGKARLLQRPHTIGHLGLAWTSDGRFVLSDGVWRSPADGEGPAEFIDLAAGGRFPSTARKSDRIAFIRPVGGSADIDRLQIGGMATPFIRSTYRDLQPQFSPDGTLVAVASSRTNDRMEIWVSKADGSNIRQVTRGPGLGQGYPGWSPKGDQIVFDSVAEDGHVDVWVIEVDGSGLRQVTRHPADDFIPSWSRDGRFIYFVSNRTGRSEVWRHAADGSGHDEQISHAGGTFPFDSFDGKTLYYKKGFADDPLIGRPVAGGDEREILPCVPIFGYATVRGGIYYHDCGSVDLGASPNRPLRFWDQGTARSRVVGVMPAEWIGGLTASPDGRTVLYGHGTSTADLLMIERFR